MPGAVGLAWDLLARDQASPAFLRVAGAADKAAVATARATAGLDQHVATAGRVGAKLTKALTLPLLGIAAVAVDQAAKYEKSLNVIRVATGQTAQSMTLAHKGLLKISNETATSTADLSQALYTAAKSGQPMAKALKTVEAAAQGAKAENADLGTVTNALTSVMASYGSKLSDPVKAMNMIVRGSGLAKTTLQDFSSSLANVVPIASSLGISFDQVVGAVDTMTQHGETAQRATENLANLITNLAGQNNVASQSLQQLGVNTVDLSKNLGKRGLVGSLDLVLNAIQKHGKDGLIVTSAFKQAGTATQALRTEIAAMPRTLQANAKAFDAGKMSYKDFLSYAKSLGGQNFQLAKGFITTEAQAKGFNNQLKNGNSNVRTLASTLQKALGGVTGMRVALMLSGQSAAQFANSSKAVADAAKNNGKDVLGFAETQKTAAFRADAAKVAFKNLAIELGTALLPAVNKLSDMGTKAAHWVDGLSHTQKTILGWSAGILAGLGPVLTLGSRLAVVGRGISMFALNAGTKIATLVGATQQTAERVGNIARGMVRGLSGILAGGVAAQIGGNSSGGWLASIMLGTAGGWALGGPIGAAVGGVSSAIFKGIGLWNDHKNAAKQAAMAERAFVDNLTSAIEADNGALGTNLRLTITKSLQDKGVLDEAQKLGLNLADVVGSAMGNTKAKTLVSSQLANLMSLNNKQMTAFEQAHGIGTYQQLRDAAAGKEYDLAKGLQLKGADLADFRRMVGMSDDIQKFRKVIGSTAGDVGKAEAKANQFAHALNDDRVATGAFGTQLVALKRHTDLAVDANGNLVTSLAKGTVVGDHNRATITSLAQAAQTDAEKTLAAAMQHNSLGKAVEIANSKLGANIGQIRRAAEAAGLNATQVEALVGKYGRIPKSVLTYVRKRGVLPADIQALIDMWNAVPRLVTTTYRTTMVNAANPGTHGDQTLAQLQHKAAGGGVNDGYFTVGERGWELGYKHGGKVTIFDNRTSQKMTGWNQVPGYAGGTPTGSALSGITSNISALLAAAHNINASASDLATAAKDLRTSARDQKLSASFQSLLARQAARLGSLGSARDRISARLGTAATGPTAYDQLATARQAYSDARSSTASAVGAFDFTTAGVTAQVFNDRPAAPVTAGSILAQLKTAAAKALRFAGLLKTLVKDGLPRDLVMQFAQAGPAAYDQAAALAAASPKELLGIKSAYAQLNAAGGAAGSTVANGFYKAGVDSAQAVVNGLLSKRSLLNKAIRELGDEMVSELEHKLGIKQSASIGHPKSTRGGKSEIHVHGISDPVTFARRVETEQARRALARIP